MSQLLKNNYRKNKWFFIFFPFFISFLMFWEFFIKGGMPYPGNFMLAWFEPWKSAHSINGVITLSHKPIADDVFRQLYPMKILAMDMIKNFQPPLWNPYNGAGMPLLATINSGFLDPLNVFYGIFPNWFAWSFGIILQPALIFTATFLYLRALQLSRISAVFGSVVFLLSGSVIVRFIYGIFGLAIALLPFILYLFECFFKNRKTKKILVLPLAIFSLIVSTQPQITLYIVVFTLTYLLVRIRQEKFYKKEVWLLPVLFFIGFGMSSVQIIPTLELALLSNLTITSSQFIFDRFLSDSSHFITLVIPNYFGNVGTYNFWEVNGDYIETALYVGTIPVFFAVVGVVWNKKKSSMIVPFLIGVIIVSFVTTRNTPFAHLFFKLPIPIISTGIPTRMFLLLVFAVSILSAIGFERVGKELYSVRQLGKRIWGVVIVYCAILVGSIFTLINNFWCPSSLLQCRMVSLRNTVLELGVFFLFFAGVMVCLLYKKRIGRTLQIIIVGLVIILGIYNSNKFQPFSKKETFYPENRLVSFLASQKSRVFGFDEARIDTNFATFFRFYDPNYYHPLYSKRYGEFVAFAQTNTYPSVLLRSDVNIPADSKIEHAQEIRRKRLLNILGVEYFLYKKVPEKKYDVVWQDTHFVVIKNKEALPKAYFVDEVITAQENDAILATLFSPSFNPRTTAVIEENLNLPKNKGKQKVTVTSYQENSLRMDVYTENDSFLVVSDNFFPGWNAYIDSHKTPVLRTNYTFRGIVVPKGAHTIEFVYQPLSFYIGLGITLLSCMCFVAFFGNKVYYRKAIKG